MLEALTELNGRDGGRERFRMSTALRHRRPIHHADSADYYYPPASSHGPFTEILVGLERGFVGTHNLLLKSVRLVLCSIATLGLITFNVEILLPVLAFKLLFVLIVDI